VNEYSVVGKPLPRVDALEKVTGKAIYTTDMHLPGMLWAKTLRSPFPHARIVNIDVTQAKRLTGVKAVLTADDTPKINFSLIPIFADQLPLTDTARFIGEAIAVVAAVDEATAEEALQLIKLDYEPLPPVFDPVEAMQPGAPRIHEHLESNIAKYITLECGNIEKGFAESDYICEDRFTTHAQSHCPMEPRCSIAAFDASGRLSVWSSTQAPYQLRERLAAACAIPMRNIRVIKPYIGGGFGVRVDMDPMEPNVVFLAKATGRPVKMAYSREEEFSATRTRHPTIMEVKIGVKKDGTLMAKQAKTIMDNGAYNSHGPAVLSYNCAMFSALYQVPNIQYDGYLVYTNKLYGGAFRGYGVPQATFAQESLMDQVAERLGMDPKELRLKNANQPGDTTANAFQITSCGLKECIEESAAVFQWGHKPAKKEGIGHCRGAGMACGIYTGMGSKGSGNNYSGASIKLDVAGSFVLATGASEIGQGSSTVLSQIAAEVLGVSIEQINLTETDTDLAPPCMGTFGSRVTYCAGRAVLEAANKMRAEILKLAAEKLNTSVEELELRDGSVSVKGAANRSLTLAELAKVSYFEKDSPIICSGYFNGPYGREFDPISYYGYPSEAFSLFNQIAEVNIDRDTGQVKVTRLVAAHDIGRAINPTMVEGQIEGGVVMGIGWALTEDTIFSQGKLVNNNFRDYKILTSLDIPEIKPVLVETIDPNGPFGAKGVGEAVMIPTAPAVTNAIYNAIGIRFRELPVTSEKILRALKEKASE